MSQGWIGVDFDGTLAVYDRWRGADHLGEPIPLMVERVKAWLARGQEVRIMTARVYYPPHDKKRWEEADASRRNIVAWCVEVFGHALEVTCTKDYGMIELWDDRCISVEKNTGRVLRCDPDTGEVLI